MHEPEQELLDIVTQVRMHVEYQRALGVTSLPVGSAAPTLTTVALLPSRTAAASAASVHASPIASQSAGLGGVRAELGDCTRCKLHANRTNIVFGEGNPHAELVFVGEGPGQEEDQQARPFVGAAGQLLTDIIVKGMQLKREDVYICNIVKCRPPDNRNPEPDEIEACEPFLIKQLLAIKPKVIVVLGNTSAKTLLKTTEGITKLRGTWKAFQGIPVMPTFHPAYLLRNPKDKALVWKDIQLVMEKLAKNKKG